jgi:hypothetical protein
LRVLTPRFTVAAEPEHDLLRLTMGGFFGIDDVAKLSEARLAGLRQLRCAANQHRTLVDVSECKLQSQDVVVAFQKVIGDPRYTSRRLAFVIGSSLARMQVRRILTRAGAALFDNVAEAEAWLLDDTPIPVAKTAGAEAA